MLGATAVETGHVRALVHLAFRHRMILNFEGEAQQVQLDDLIDEVLKAVPSPADEVR
jgi:MoxR-like ATPase